MPIIYVPDNTPSRNYAGNSRTTGYAHPAHGIIGGLAKSDTDPRNRGRQRTRDEIESSSRARNDAKRERLAKLREDVTKQQESDKEAKASKRLRVAADTSAAALANNPEAARGEVARQQTAAAAEAKRGKPVTRLTAEQQEANRAANQAANQRALARPVDAMSLMSDRMKPEGPSLSDTLAASEAAGRPHVARAVSNLFAAPAAMPAAAAPAAPAAPSMQQEKAPEEPTVFNSREEMLRAAMNPSGRRTPLATRRGSMDSTPGLSNAITEATHPQFKNTMSAADREFVDNQQRGLSGMDSMLYTVPTGMAKFYGDTLSQDNPLANSDLLGTVTPEYDAQRRREMSPEPSSIYATPSYLRDEFRFDPSKSGSPTFSSREDVERAAMNPSDAATPTPRRQGAIEGLDAQDNSLSNLPESDRKFVENQLLNLQGQGQIPNYLDLVGKYFSGVDLESEIPVRYDFTRGFHSDINKIKAGFNNAASGARAVKDTIDRAISGGVESTVNAATDAMNALKPSMSFRPGMEFGTPKSRPTAIGANATGMSAGRPERKKETFMDFLRSNFPESFSDPNSMYYFPGKFY